MSRQTIGIRFVCVVAILTGVSARATAQPEPTGGPFSGLFRGSPQNQPHTLDVNGSVFGAWDDNPYAAGLNGIGGFGLPAGVQGGLADGAQASIRYGFNTSGTRSHLSINGIGSLQDFGTSQNSKRLFFQSYDVGAAMMTDISHKVSLTVSGTSAYAPYYQYAPFLKSTTTDESPAGADYGYAVTSDWVRSTLASATLQDRFTKRSSVGATLSWNQAVLPAQDLTTDIRAASLFVGHNITRKLNAHVGIGVAETSYADKSGRSAPTRSAFMDVGLGYGDGLILHFARYYTLNLGVGASIQKNGDPASVAKTGRDTAFVGTGNATLSRSIGRSWSTSIGYVRGVSYVVGFPQPIVMDSATSGISGQITKRLYFSAGAGASRGQEVFSENGTLVAYTASSRLTYGLFTHLGLFAQTSYYKFSIPNAFEIFGFTPLLQRRSVSVGLNAWLPLIKPSRARRTPDEPPTGQLQ